MIFAIVRMHFAHMVFWTRWPFSRTVTRCKLGRNARLVARCEKLLLWPNTVVFPHVSHFAIFIFLSFTYSFGALDCSLLSEKQEIIFVENNRCLLSVSLLFPSLSLSLFFFDREPRFVWENCAVVDCHRASDSCYNRNI